MREGSKLSFPGAGNGRFHVSETRTSTYRKRELPRIGNESFRVSETRTSDTRNKS
ncbi:hypothetical protein [Parabacteroides distasonis]|uniref:hypothetical protein n=1 Tax=Parabacteroides distasonis TaxID=823 RepID=UPI002804D83E|nr:hypothetical protein [Parabacteroides distasonis]WMI43156.1 hypothetical protein Q8809_02185 [Parabacteroides distasonis]